jgi:hypothetical protein
LQATAEELNNTRLDLSEALSKLKKTRRELNEKGHVVQQARELLEGVGGDLRSQLETASSTLLQTATASLDRGVGRMQDSSETSRACSWRSFVVES